MYDKPVVVGALSCQRNPFMFEGFITNVVSCQEYVPKSKKDKTTGYTVELKDTILFPEGGGQPSDCGFLKALTHDEQEKLITVSHVFRDGLHAIHQVDEYVEPGTKVEVIVNREKRFDYMQQHSGQHLLSCVLDKLNLPTLSWSMGGVITDKKPVLEPSDYFNYIEIGRKLTDEEIEDVTKQVNDYITINTLPITVKERTAELQDGIDSSKIPEDYDLEKGILRTIHIGQLDANPCCGTHLTNTSQIESILILPHQTTVRGTNSRLYFMCGSRIRQYAKSSFQIINQVKQQLSCSETAITEKVTLLKDQIQQNNKREQFWIKELATLEAQKLIQNLQNEQYDNNLISVLKDEFGSLEYLLQIYKEIAPTLTNLDKPYQILLCGREKTSGNGSMILLSDSGETINNLQNELKTKIQNLRGGGGKNGGKWQGKITDFKDNEWVTLETLCLTL